MIGDVVRIRERAHNHFRNIRSRGENVETLPWIICENLLESARSSSLLVGAQLWSESRERDFHFL
jgi:hypothetical protein